jgi:hypothetical protein
MNVKTIQVCKKIESEIEQKKLKVDKVVRLSNVVNSDFLVNLNRQFGPNWQRRNPGCSRQAKQF